MLATSPCALSASGPVPPWVQLPSKRANIVAKIGRHFIFAKSQHIPTEAVWLSPGVMTTIMCKVSENEPWLPEASGNNPRQFDARHQDRIAQFHLLPQPPEAQSTAVGVKVTVSDVCDGVIIVERCCCLSGEIIVMNAHKQLTGVAECNTPCNQIQSTIGFRPRKNSIGGIQKAGHAKLSPLPACTAIEY